MKENLQSTLENVEKKREATEELLVAMGKQRGEAQQKQEEASKERIRAENFAKEASAIQADAEVELSTAEPALVAAKNAIDCLTKSALTELKSLSKPPQGVDKVTTCVLMLVQNEKKNFSWKNAKVMMQNIDQFIGKLRKFDARALPKDVLARLGPILSDTSFTYEKLAKKSSAAANLANWVINTVQYHNIYVNVKPLMDKLDAAQKQKDAAMADLAAVEEQMNEIMLKLDGLQKSFMTATNEKAAVEAEAKSCAERLELAERLVNGLSSENERWGEEVERLIESQNYTAGDTLLAASFASYVGAFDAQIRREMWKETWTQDILSREIPLSKGITPMSVLCTANEADEWRNEGLPDDPMSSENGAIVTACTRWPLLIDPQLQGILWVRNRHDTVVQTTQANWIQKLKSSIQEGGTIVIENIGKLLTLRSSQY